MLFVREVLWKNWFLTEHNLRSPFCAIFFLSSGLVNPIIKIKTHLRDNMPQSTTLVTSHHFNIWLVKCQMLLLLCTFIFMSLPKAFEPLLWELQENTCPSTRFITWYYADAKSRMEDEQSRWFVCSPPSLAVYLSVFGLNRLIFWWQSLFVWPATRKLKDNVFCSCLRKAPIAASLDVFLFVVSFG